MPYCDTGNAVSLSVAPTESLGEIGADVAAKLIAAAADVALIIDADGVIRDVASHNTELAELGRAAAVARPAAALPGRRRVE